MSGVRVFFAEWWLDTGTRQLGRNHDEVTPLTPKAFDVLALLVRERPNVVKINDILDAVWSERHVGPGSVTVTIADLRKVLGDTTTEPRFIRTVHRVGYAFICPVNREPESTFHLAGNRQLYPLYNRENLVGRTHECAVVLEDASVSRRHARIAIDATGATLEDVGSRNGTFLRGERVTTRQSIRPGDVIVFGDVRLIFQTTETRPVDPPA